MANARETDGPGLRPATPAASSRSGVVVLGMHRSGTSAVTGVLRRMGCRLGAEAALMPAQPDNPRGFGERLDAYELNEELLRDLGAHWSAPAGLDLDRLGPARRRPLERRAAAIADDLRSRSPWAFKDPRLCLLLPFWRRFLDEPAVVLVLRHPLAVARSLAARNDLEIATGLALWEQHTLGALRHTRDLPCLTVAYEELLDRPDSTARRLAGELSELGVPGLRAPSSEELRELVDRSLRHHRADTETDDEALPAPVRALWTALAAGSLPNGSAWLPHLSEPSLRRLLDRRAELRDAGGKELLPPSPVLDRPAILHGERLARLENEIERLEVELEASRADAEEARRLLWRRDREAALALGRSEHRLAGALAHIQRLEDWLGELATACDALLASRRWRLGSLLAGLRRRLLLRSPAPDPAAHPRRVLATWRGYSSEVDRADRTHPGLVEEETAEAAEDPR